MLDFIMTHFDELLIAITSILTGASALAALTPTQKDDLILKYISRFLDFLALNVGHAKRAEA